MSTLVHRGRHRASGHYVRTYKMLPPWVHYLLTAIMAAALLAILLSGCKVTEPVTVPSRTVTVEEDEPGWDCRTMGNRLCGPSHG